MENQPGEQLLDELQKLKLENETLMKKLEMEKYHKERYLQSRFGSDNSRSCDYCHETFHTEDCDDLSVCLRCYKNICFLCPSDNHGKLVSYYDAHYSSDKSDDESTEYEDDDNTRTHSCCENILNVEYKKIMS
jgi:hypothetical protein